VKTPTRRLAEPRCRGPWAYPGIHMKEVEGPILTFNLARSVYVAIRFLLMAREILGIEYLGNTSAWHF